MHLPPGLSDIKDNCCESLGEQTGAADAAACCPLSTSSCAGVAALTPNAGAGADTVAAAARGGAAGASASPEGAGGNWAVEAPGAPDDSSTLVLTCSRGCAATGTTFSPRPPSSRSSLPMAASSAASLPQAAAGAAADSIVCAKGCCAALLPFAPSPFQFCCCVGFFDPELFF